MVEVGLSESEFLTYLKQITQLLLPESCMNGITTTTTQLDLPFDKVVGCPPYYPLERDLAIPVQDVILSVKDRISNISISINMPPRRKFLPVLVE